MSDMTQDITLPELVEPEPPVRRLTTIQRESSILFSSNVPISAPINHGPTVPLGGFGWDPDVGIVIPRRAVRGEED